MKMNSSGGRAIGIALAIILTLFLYLAPRKKEVNAVAAVSVTEDVKMFDDLIRFQEQNLSNPEKASVAEWKKSIASKPTEYPAYDSLSALWDSKKMFALSGYYYEQKSKADRTEKSSLHAAYRFFDAYKQAVDSGMKQVMVKHAMENYEKVIEMNPANLDAKTDLGILYAEATSEPMKGIMMLREVVEANPNHENAQFNLGILSVRSGQYEKAIERFQRVLEINPGRSEMYFYLGQACLQAGKKEEALESFRKFRKAATDPEAIALADQMINKIMN